MEVFFPPERRLLDPLTILTLIQKILSQRGVWNTSHLLVNPPEAVLLLLASSLSLALYVPPPDIHVMPALLPPSALLSSARKVSSAILATETDSVLTLQVSQIPRLLNVIVSHGIVHPVSVAPEVIVVPVFQRRALSSARVPDPIRGATGRPARRFASEAFPPFFVPSYLSSSEKMRLLIFPISEITS